MNLPISVLSGVLFSALAPTVHRLCGRNAGWVLALFPFGLFLYFASLLFSLTGNESLIDAYQWVPSLGVQLAFRADGLSLLFTLFITGIGVFVLIYAGGYLAGHKELGRFYAFLLFFMTSMLGLVLSENVILLFVFWELTSVSSYLLIGFDHEREEARRAALQALLVTALGGLALLAGLLLLGQAGGSLELTELLGQREAVQGNPLYLGLLLLILTGAFTKSAQFPFHFWLPAAMEAPTPVSAYLHAATMVKAGVYLLARLSPVLGGTEVWFYLVTATGAATMLVGAYIAYHETDLKRILAYSTVSALGIFILLLGLGTDLAVQAAIVSVMAHAGYKGALFLVAGAVDHETGTRDIRKFGGLRVSMPVTAAAAMLAAISMAGLPPLFGFLAKELLYDAVLQAGSFGLVLVAGVMSASMLLLAVAGLAGVAPFFGKKLSTPRNPHEAPVSLWLGPCVLAGLGLLSGLLPGLFGRWLVSPAVASVLAQPSRVELALFHGWNPILLLSAVTLAGGLGLYAWRSAVQEITTASLSRLTVWGPSRWYEVALGSLNAVARAQTRVLQSGYLRYYLLTIVATTVGLTAYTLLSRVTPFPAGDWSSLPFYQAALGVLIILAVLAAVRLRSRLAAVAALGVVGYAIALIFVLFGAPDLAVTQFLVETLTVILLVLILYRLPRFATLSSQKVRARDAVVALVAGGLMTALVLVANSVQHLQNISYYFGENSLPRAHGRNVVNVILVDFRGLDTMGEITVLAVAGVGVYSLLKLRIGKGEPL